MARGSRPSPKPLLPPAGALALALMAAGCSSPSPWKKEKAFSEAPIVLYREHLETEGKRTPVGYRHPIDLTAAELAAVFGQLRYQKSYLWGRSDLLEVFTRAEALALAPPVASELIELSPDERLRFLVMDSAWSEVLVGPRGTSGVIFSTTPGIVNIAFDSIQERIDMRDGGRPEDVIFSREPTQLTDDPPMLGGRGLKAHQDATTEREYPRWLEIDVAVVRAARTAGSRAATEPGVAGVPATSSPTPPGEAETRVRRRLESLKRLHVDGSLTDEQYQQAVQAALEEL